MKHKKMSIVIFDPKENLFGVKHPLKRRETVLYLGEIVNVPGHCAVAKKDGEVIWLVHPEDFRKAKESEL
jgi:hypothetical protein